MAPLILKYTGDSYFQTLVCTTGQHKEMLDQVLEFFEITVDYRLDVMTENQTLSSLTSKAISEVDQVIQRVIPDLIFVQGDTTSALVGAMAGFYSRVPIVHIEAGLRSGNLSSPFPEEGNRRLISQLTTYHMIPTTKNKEDLLKENFFNNLFVVGNTVIDALFAVIKKLKENKFLRSEYLDKLFNNISFNKKIILITFHRRESLGAPMIEICEAINELILRHDIHVIFPIHKNPKVRQIAENHIQINENITIIEPLNYIELVQTLEKSYLVLTDSGGIQEEAPSLGKPVLVLRDVTERTEGIDAGTAILVGTNKERILSETLNLIENRDYYQQMANVNNPYGDGLSSEKIIHILKQLE